MITKLCRKCKIDKPSSEFHICNSNKDKLQSYCKICKLEYTNTIMKEYRKNYFDSRKKKKKEYDKIRYDKYRETIIERCKEYKLNHKEFYKSYDKKYRKIYENTKKGKIVRSRINHKRQRNMKFVPLFENPFPNEIEVDYHHINNVLVIPLPRTLHQLNNTRYSNVHREKCEDIIKSIYGLDINIFYD